jgi:hypothetical protein
MYPKETPLQVRAIETYIDAFNSGAVNDQIDGIYHFPLVWVIDGSMTIQQTPPSSIVSYENLKKSGWAYSKANKVKILSEGQNTSVVRIDLSRYTDDHQEILRTEAFYTMINNGGDWKIATITIPVSLPVLEDVDDAIKSQ